MFAGLVLRLLLAVRSYPVGGDPLFSYAYRGLLLSRGEWEGLFLMWHPPGLPLLIAAGTALLGFMLSPYFVGVAIALASFVAVVVLADTLLVEAGVSWEARIVAASFLCLYDLMILTTQAPLTEMPFLAAVLGSVVLARRGTLLSALGAGALAGVAGLLRFEGFGVALGIAVLCVSRAEGTESSGRPIARAFRAATFAAGVLPAGLLILAGDGYLAQSIRAFSATATLAAGSGVGALDPGRLLRSLYLALVEWLPRVVLLPFWLLVGLGIGVGFASPRSRGVLVALAAAAIPNLLFTATSIMHRRTGTFLLPLVAVAIALGVDGLRERDRHSGKRPALLLTRGLFWATLVLQLFRIPWASAPARGGERNFSLAVAAILEDSICRQAPVYAFGSEPEVYALARFPVVYRYFEREERYERLYEGSRSRPEGFVAALRRAGFGFLAFSYRTETGGETGRGEPQRYWMHLDAPDRSDLATLQAGGELLGIREIGRRALAEEPGQVVVVEIDAPGLASRCGAGEPDV